MRYYKISNQTKKKIGIFVAKTLYVIALLILLFWFLFSVAEVNATNKRVDDGDANEYNLFVIMQNINEDVKECYA